MTHSDDYFISETKQVVRFLTYSAMMIFVVLAGTVLLSDVQQTSLSWFKYLSTGIACFMAGCLWGAAFFVKLDSENFEFNRFGAIFGGLLVVLISVSTLMLSNKVGLFLAAMVFLLLWQVENKTNLAKIYPEWYWVLRTQASMVVAAIHMLLWMLMS